MKKFIFALILIALPILSFAQNDSKKRAYYFYGEQCPHCKNVDEYFTANGIYDKYEITKLEVVENPFNAKIFLEFGKAFGADNWGGVPTVVFGNKYLSGDTPIIDNFVREIEAAENANELPDPAKIAGAGKNSQPASVSAENENKKNYFPVIIGALLIVGAGALIFINRKKS